jgi:hypothetical protein
MKYPFEQTETKVLKALDGLEPVARRSILANVLAYEILNDCGRKAFEEQVGEMAALMVEIGENWFSAYDGDK